MPARSTLFLQPKPGRRDDLIEAFKRIDVFGHALKHEGCVSIEMLTPDEPNDPVAVIALWTSRAGIEGWLDSPRRAESTRDLDPFIERVPESVIYDIVISAPAEAGT